MTVEMGFGRVLYVTNVDVGLRRKHALRFVPDTMVRMIILCAAGMANVGLVRMETVYVIVVAMGN
jgi:hypothetical protein